jgi:G3E family GTPase
MTFRADRPFHPLRLSNALDELRGLLRSKGFCWIATRPSIAAIWSQAGPNLVIEPAQYWSTTELEPSQAIVLIGVRLDKAKLTRLLEAALSTDAELAEGERAWQAYPDPLPAWGVTHSHAH